MDDLGAARAIGMRLREVRRKRGLTLHGVERATREEFKGSVLGAYERGDRILTVPRLQRLALFYGVPVDEILLSSADIDLREKARDGDAGDRGRETPALGIDVERLGELRAGEWRPLQRYVATVEQARGGVPARVLTLRASDLDAIARMYGLEEDVVLTRLEVAGLIPARAIVAV
jgi:transcriptional regulator with XRE-family HTH domain